MTRHLYDRLRAEVAELRRRLSVVSTGGGGGGSHASSHEDGGADEIDVTGLTGLLATPQTPATHATSHQNSGGDEISVAGLSGQLADAQLVGVRKNSAGTVFTRSRLNLIEGSNVTLTVADDGTEVDVTIASSGGAVSDGDKGDVTVSSSGTVWTIDNNVVTNAKSANMADSTIKGRAVGAGTGDPTDLTANQTSTILDTATDPFLRTSAASAGGITQLTGNVTAGPGSGSQAATIPNDTVTYAKIQNISAADRLLGRGNGGGSGDTQEIALGNNVFLSGTTLNVNVSGTGTGSSARAIIFAAGDSGGLAPSDGTTYYFGAQFGFDPGTAIPLNAVVISPITGTVKRVRGRVVVLGTLGSAQNTSFSIRNVTDATTEVIDAAVPMTAAGQDFSNTNMTLALDAGDTMCIQFTTPTWSPTNPTACYFMVTAEIEP